VDSKAVFQLSLRKYNEGVALFPDCSSAFCHVLYVTMSCMEEPGNGGANMLKESAWNLPRIYTHLRGLGKLYVNVVVVWKHRSNYKDNRTHGLA